MFILKHFLKGLFGVKDDNHIYKFVLNGKKQVSIPPGFENNSKEAEEIEELGKKIATFQIETDT